MKRFYLVLGLLLCFFVEARAADLGVVARTWPIAEIDLTEIVRQQLSPQLLREIYQKIQQSMLKLLQVTAKLLPQSMKLQIHYYDPSVHLTQDIKVQGKLLYSSGEKINPLHYVRPTTSLIFFDSNDQAQLTFVGNLLKQYPYHIVPVLITGEVTAASKRLGQTVYQAYPQLLARFHLKRTPTLLTLGRGKHRDQLAVIEIAEPFEQVDLAEYFHG